MNSLESDFTQLVNKTTTTTTNANMSTNEEYFQVEGTADMSTNYVQTENTNTNEMHESNGSGYNGTISVAPDSPPGTHAGGVSIGAGITLMQSSPPPASYRHSRAYRHFKNPPQPHMCIRTTTESGEELFINVLSWTRIVIPQEPSDPIPLYGGMRVPPGSPRSPPIVFAVMANPEVLKDSGRHSKDAEERRAMVELMCDFVEAMNPGVKLVRNAVILKDRDISGELKDVWNAVQAQRDREREEQLLQQRQQQQYITTQQMFPKTGQTGQHTSSLPTPSSILIGGRCGSLVGSGNEITRSEATQNATSEENSSTSSNYETTVGEESETTYIVTTTSTLSANTIESTNTTTTTTGTSNNTTTTTTNINDTNNSDECASISNKMNTIKYEEQEGDIEKEMDVVILGKDSVDSVNSANQPKNNKNYINNNNNINNDNNKNKFNKSNNQLLALNEITTTTTTTPATTNINQLCNKTANHQQEHQNVVAIPTTSTKTTTLLPATTKLAQITETTTTTTTIQLNNANDKLKTPTTTMTENTAINALSNNNPTTTTTTIQKAITAAPAPATTTTPTLLTKREKLGGFLPNGCIFPRFKNNKKDKEKDKEKEKEKETKCKDKEKNLLYALKKSKEKKIAPLNVDKKSQGNKQDKVATSTQQQQQQLVTQYDKNCINLENEMQKLELNNKINETTNNSEKNMFNKLKCAASSAAAK